MTTVEYEVPTINSETYIMERGGKIFRIRKDLDEGIIIDRYGEELGTKLHIRMDEVEKLLDYILGNEENDVIYGDEDEDQQPKSVLITVNTDNSFFNTFIQNYDCDDICTIIETIKDIV